jgi:outer membrane lipoprotein-sorting protein
MKKTILLRFLLAGLLACPPLALAQAPAPAAAPATPAAKSPQEILAAALGTVVALVEPPATAQARTFSARLQIVQADGVAKELAGRTAELAFQAPDHFKLAAQIEGRDLVLCRDGQQLWLNAPAKQFGLLGSPDVPRFATAPDKKDGTQMPPVKLPLPKDQFLLFPLLLQVEALPSERIDDVRCHVLRAAPQPQTIDAFNLPKGEIKVWVRETDSLPARLAVFNDKGFNLVLELHQIQLTTPWAPEKWKLDPGAGGKVETVALSHLTKFVPAALSLLTQKIPTLGEARGERKVLATEGQGRLEDQDGTKVLFLKGSPEEMGRQHGVLMRKQVKDLVSRVLYGVGVGSSFEKARWFFGEIEEAQRRLLPFMDERYLKEMDALALAAGTDREEIRLANFFPELFHCSGFSVYGSATVEGRMYHGRILDYMKGVGLEQNAVVIVSQPDYGNAWVNISYAGCIGSVTAMNARRISIGEMGGRGEGRWDGKPMAQLVREVMEKAGTLDEAIDIMRKGPRTCEYYYVISDGNTKRAAGIAATPDTFEVIKPGEAHPQLPHPIKDAVLMSAGDRYEKLAERVQEQHGKLDADSARRLMDRPVCMKSNIHSVLFAPDTLDFWVANADSKNVASHTRYTHYNLGDLLKSEPAKAVAAAGPGSGGAAR